MADHVWLALMLVLLGGVGFRFYQLDKQALWADELHRVIWAKGYEVTGFFDVAPESTGAKLPPAGFRQSWRVVSAHNPPLNALVLNGWMRLTRSETDFSVRFPCALLGALAILGAFLAGRQLLGAKTGVWLAALVAFSPFHVFYVQEASHYALTACLVAFSLWFYARWLERKSVVNGIGLAVISCAAIYSHYYALIAIFFQGVELLVRHRKAPKQLGIAVLPYAGVLAGFAPYLPTARSQLREMTEPALVGNFQGLGYFFDRLPRVLDAQWTGDLGEYLPPLQGVPFALAGCVLFVLGIRAVKHAPTKRMLLINGLGPLLFVCATYWLLRSNNVLWARYQLFFTFAQLIPIAVALERLRVVRWVAVPGLVYLAVIGFKFMYVDLVKEDWKGAATTIARNGGPSDGVVVFLPNMSWALARYLETPNRLYGIDGDEAKVKEQLATASPGRPAMWFVTAWAPGPQIPDVVHGFLGCRYGKRDAYPVNGGRIGMTVTRYSEPKECPAMDTVVAP